MPPGVTVDVLDLVAMWVAAVSSDVTLFKATLWGFKGRWDTSHEASKHPTLAYFRGAILFTNSEWDIQSQLRHSHVVN